MTELIERIIPRLSDEERRIMALKTVQLGMSHLDTLASKGLLIENRDKASAATMKSLKTRGLTTGSRNNRSGVVPLSSLGEQVNEALQ